MDDPELFELDEAGERVVHRVQGYEPVSVSATATQLVAMRIVEAHVRRFLRGLFAGSDSLSDE